MYGVNLNVLYDRTRRRGQWGQIWAALSGHSRQMLALSEVEQRTVRDRHDAGVQTVRIDRVQGSAGRYNDFDRTFHPLQDHTKRRWLSVARARQEGKSLPPVELVQVGETYFCLDGHHRLSVARAFQQLDIEATVTVWQVAEPLPSASSEGLTQSRPDSSGASHQESKRHRLNLRGLLPVRRRAGRAATA
jgi:hypothetical protein